MIKAILPTDFKKMRRLVFGKYIPALVPLYDGSGISTNNRTFYWKELVSVKLLFDFLIAFSLLLAPSVDNSSSKTVTQVIPFAIDFITVMPEEMITALNEEQQKLLKSLSMSSSQHLTSLQKKIVVTRKNKMEYLKFYKSVLSDKLTRQ